MRRSALLLALAVAPPLHADVEGEIPLGIEALTGVRTAYVHRGFELAGTLFEFQLEGEVALQDALFLSFGGWIATESGGDFEELAGFLDLRRDLGDLFTVGLSATCRSYDNTFFEDGFDIGVFTTLHATEDLEFTLGAFRDLGADGWHALAESGWSTRLGEDSYLSLLAGLSWVDGYYGRSGMNDFHGRAAITYNLNKSVALTPFVGWSLEIDDTAGDGDELFGGLWFEVVF